MREVATYARYVEIVLDGVEAEEELDVGVGGMPCGEDAELFGGRYVASFLVVLDCALQGFLVSVGHGAGVRGLSYGRGCDGAEEQEQQKELAHGWLEFGGIDVEVGFGAVAGGAAVKGAFGAEGEFAVEAFFDEVDESFA